MFKMLAYIAGYFLFMGLYYRHAKDAGKRDENFASFIACAMLAAIDFLLITLTGF
jgi:hypothetical protein